MKGLRTKKVNTIKEGTLIVAVDIGMVSNHGCCTTKLSLSFVEVERTPFALS
jgi:hypothetical protein